MLLHLNPSDAPLAQAFQKFVRGTEFPCVGAKSACANHRLFFFNAQDIRSARDDLRIHRSLARFVRLYRQNVGDLWSFAILFHHLDAMSEADFEGSLWARLQSLADTDEGLGYTKHARKQGRTCSITSKCSITRCASMSETGCCRPSSSNDSRQ